MMSTNTSGMITIRNSYSNWYLVENDSDTIPFASGVSGSIREKNGLFCSDFISGFLPNRQKGLSETWFYVSWSASVIGKDANSVGYPSGRFPNGAFDHTSWWYRRCGKVRFFSAAWSRFIGWCHAKTSVYSQSRITTSNQHVFHLRNFQDTSKSKQSTALYLPPDIQSGKYVRVQQTATWQWLPAFPAGDVEQTFRLFEIDAHVPILRFPATENRSPSRRFRLATLLLSSDRKPLPGCCSLVWYNFINLAGHGSDSSGHVCLRLPSVGVPSIRLLPGRAMVISIPMSTSRPRYRSTANSL